MKYALLIYGKEADWANASPDEMTAIFAEHGRLSDALGTRNLAGEELDLTTTATTACPLSRSASAAIAALLR